MCSKNELKHITDVISNKAKIIFADKLMSVILYGSYARGDNHTFSDIDIMIIANIDSEKLSEYREKLAKISSDLSMDSEDCITISIAIQDQYTFDKFKEVLPFYQNVINEGVYLYAS